MEDVRILTVYLPSARLRESRFLAHSCLRTLTERNMHFRACAAGDHLRHAYAAPARRYRNARCDGEKSGGDSEPASGLSYVGKIAPFRPNDLLTAEVNASPQGLPFSFAPLSIYLM